MENVSRMGIAKEILESLTRFPKQSPSSLNENIQGSLSAVKNALVVLSDLGLVGTPSRGVYVITPLGTYVLENIPKETPRTCPLCGQDFKPMTDALWDINLFQHLIASKKHRMPPEEAEKYISHPR